MDAYKVDCKDLAYDNEDFAGVGYMDSYLDSSLSGLDNYNGMAFDIGYF